MSKNGYKLLLAFFSAVVLSLFSSQAGAQILKPVKWSFTASQVTNNDAVLEFTAKIEKGWHLYSQNIPDGGPIPTSFSFEKNKKYELAGKATESGKSKEVDDPNFGMKLKYFSDEAVFRQKIKINSKDRFKITGTLEFMVCDDEKCLPPKEENFEFEISGGVIKEENNQSPGENGINASTVDTNISAVSDSISKDSTITKAYSGLEPDCGGTEPGESDMSLWGIFIAGMIGGLLALLTPCVFPMIPLTVSFFTKQSKDRKKGVMNALIYAISIIFIYVGLGFIISKVFGSDALNAMASNALFNLAFFFIFIIFAISFFGAFEITLPSSWINKADKAADKGGLLGIFFMAFTLSLVSFSCTGPIIGTLLVESAVKGSNLGPIAGMTGFAFSLAVPFAFFAAFPGWLQSLPKSGGWLNSVKVSLGFLELALALKFFSNVDLAYHWGFLKRELFLVLWVIIFGLWGVYLLGWIRFSHDSELKYISIPRLLFAILVFCFTAYLIPGLWGAPLKLISGFPPPEFYKEWTNGNSTHCPHNLNCFHDYDEGMEYAKQEGKPVILDFTGWSCVNCRKMEENVWSDPQVLKRLSEKYVLISLYVDDKTALPEKEQYISKFSGEKVKSIGNKWSDFQASRYNKNSQPYYVLLDHNENWLALPREFDLDIDAYVKFLDEGLCRFEMRQQK